MVTVDHKYHPNIIAIAQGKGITFTIKEVKAMINVALHDCTNNVINKPIQKKTITGILVKQVRSNSVINIIQSFIYIRAKKIRASPINPFPIF